MTTRTKLIAKSTRWAHRVMDLLVDVRISRGITAKAASECAGFRSRTSLMVHEKKERKSLKLEFVLALCLAYGVHPVDVLRLAPESELRPWPDAPDVDGFAKRARARLAAAPRGTITQAQIDRYLGLHKNYLRKVLAGEYQMDLIRAHAVLLLFAEEARSGETPLKVHELLAE